MLPIYSARVLSSTTINNRTNDDLVMVNNIQDEPLNHNIVVLDEKLL
jgi:hypothetical protein